MAEKNRDTRSERFGRVFFVFRNGTRAVAEYVSRATYDEFLAVVASPNPGETFVLWADDHKFVVPYAAVREHRWAAGRKAG